MKNIITFLIYFNVIIYCYAESIFKFPNNNIIREYVSCETILASIRVEELIIPSYKIVLTKNKSSKIKELEFEIIYLYGQNFDFRERKYFILDEYEINELNQTGILIISRSLPKIKREPQVIAKNSRRYVAPDGEDIQDIFYKLVIE